MSNENIVLSIIIPHANRKELLNQALLSIPFVTNLEIIIVDNSDIQLQVDEIKRKNVKLLYSDKKKGAGCARNVGINAANGTWLLFLDSDDYFTKNAFKIFDKYKEIEADIIYFKMDSIYLLSKEKGNRGDRYNELIDNYLINQEKFSDALRYNHTSPCAKMIQKKLIVKNNIQFDEIPAGNDILFATKVGHYANNIAASSEYVYCATVHDESLTRTITFNNIESRFISCLSRNKFLRSVRKNKFQWSVMGFIYAIRKYGFKQILLFVFLVLKFKNNPFIGFFNWYRTYKESK